MILKKKNRYRPHYKQLINLKENLQNRNKLLNFKKKKWQKFILIYKRKLNLYKKIKPKDQIQYLVSKHSNINFAYKKEYKNTLTEINKFKLIYGGLLNKTIKLLLNNNNRLMNRVTFLKIFESRLDVILFRCKFGSTIRSIRQLIGHGKVFVNNKKITIKSFILKSGDIIKIKLKSYQSFKNNILYSMWLAYHKHLMINYKTMEIIIVSLENNNYSLSLFYYIDLEKILLTKFKRK
jgi:ribosomal protein S4